VAEHIVMMDLTSDRRRMTQEVGRVQSADVEAPGRQAVARRALGPVTPGGSSSVPALRNGHISGTGQQQTGINSGDPESAEDAQEPGRPDVPLHA
jgi:hypothetical protein